MKDLFLGPDMDLRSLTDRSGRDTWGGTVEPEERLGTNSSILQNTPTRCLPKRPKALFFTVGSCKIPTSSCNQRAVGLLGRST